MCEMREPSALVADELSQRDLATFANVLGAPSEDETEQEGVTEREFFAAVAERIRPYSSAFIEEVKRKKEKQLEKFAMNEQPQFRPYVDRAKQNLDRLKARPTKRDVELAPYEAKIDGRVEMDDLVRKIIAGSEAHQMIDTVRQQLIA